MRPQFARIIAIVAATAAPLLGLAAASPAHADTSPPSGCVSITDNNGVSGFPIHGNGHDKQVTTVRSSDCYTFINPFVSGGHTWYQLQETGSGLCLNDGAAPQLRLESCPLNNAGELVRIVGTGNNQLEFKQGSNYVTAASIMSGANVNVSTSSTPTGTNEWTFTKPVMHVIPVLFDGPTDANWTTIEKSEPYGAVNNVVVEICDLSGKCGGAATAKNPNWPATLDALVSAGIRPMYYIDTNFGAVAEKDVKTAIDNAMTWYGSDGIGFMFDQVDGTIATKQYYADLYNYVSTTKNNKNTIFFNAGSPPQYDMIVSTGSQTIIQVVENSETVWQGSLTFPSWMNSYNGSQFSVTIHDATANGWQQDMKLCDTRKILGGCYVTDETDGKYDVLPTFFANETAKAASYTS
jgi:hypothetical protein